MVILEILNYFIETYMLHAIMLAIAFILMWDKSKDDDKGKVESKFKSKFKSKSKR